jgi:hypothetical protein
MGCSGKNETAVFVPHIGMFNEKSKFCAGSDNYSNEKLEKIEKPRKDAMQILQTGRASELQHLTTHAW